MVEAQTLVGGSVTETGFEADPVARCDVAKRLRVLHVIEQLRPGGTERVILTLMREQRKLGIEVKLCVLGSENAFLERFSGFEVDFLGYSGSLRDLSGLRDCLRKLRRKIERYKPDVVHAHLWPTARWTAWAMRGAGRPLLVHIHDAGPWLVGRTWRDRMMHRLTRWAFRRTRPHFVAVSQACRRYTLKHLPWLEGPIDVVPNAFDSSDFPNGSAASEEDGGTSSVGPIAPSIPVVGTAGRFSEEKGHEHLIRAIGCLRDRGIDVRLRIAGDGGLRSQYEGLIDELELRDWIELAGKVADMEAFYKGLDVYVQSSTGAEGMPIVILEAMAMGLPIISTDVAGAPEVIRDGEHGLLVPPADPSALGDAIERFLKDTTYSRRLGCSARELVLTEFTGERMARRVKLLYEKTRKSAPY